MVALILSCLIFAILRVNHLKLIKFLAVGFIVPLIAFAGTSSVYVLNFILQSNISESGE